MVFGLTPAAQMNDFIRRKVSFYPTITTHVFPTNMLTDEKSAISSWVGLINMFVLLGNCGGY